MVHLASTEVKILQNNLKPAASNIKITAAMATAAPGVTNVAIINNLVAGSGKTTGLPTATIIRLKTQEGSKLLRVLFDQGAQQ